MSLSRRAFLASAAAAPLAAPLFAQNEKPRTLVIIAGTPSHPPGMHEFNAGVRLLEQALLAVPGLKPVVHLNGYPKDDSSLDSADGILCYADGGPNHPLIQGKRPERIGALLAKGVGLMCAHYAVEVPKGKFGDLFRDWIGGAYEHEYSCNPLWVAEYKSFPEHPITRGVKPFGVKDEWYFNMRFRPEMKGVTPLLVATPTDATRDGPYVYPKGPYRHIQTDKGRPETMMWCAERPDGGRGVGFTGGHFHANWGDDNFRKVVLNALLWICKADVPANGVESAVSAEELTRNLDPKGKK